MAYTKMPLHFVILLGSTKLGIYFILYSRIRRRWQLISNMPDWNKKKIFTFLYQIWCQNRFCKTDEKSWNSRRKVIWIKCEVTVAQAAAQLNHIKSEWQLVCVTFQSALTLLSDIITTWDYEHSYRNVWDMWQLLTNVMM